MNQLKARVDRLTGRKQAEDSPITIVRHIVSPQNSDTEPNTFSWINGEVTITRESGESRSEFIAPCSAAGGR